VTKQLYFTDNGRDWLSEDLPEDELNRVTRIGEHFGFPYCHQGKLTDRAFGWGRSCEDGSLLVSDDYAGAVYRVSYAPERAARR
jgi:glucose/arabinose dehydrogenase